MTTEYGPWPKNPTDNPEWTPEQNREFDKQDDTRGIPAVTIRNSVLNGQREIGEARSEVIEESDAVEGYSKPRPKGQSRKKVYYGAMGTNADNDKGAELRRELDAEESSLSKQETPIVDPEIVQRAKDLVQRGDQEKLQQKAEASTEGVLQDD